MTTNPVPSELSAWSWGTLQQLCESNHPEGTHLEYKRHLEYPDDDDTSKTEWRRNVEREFTAFANASGGTILFGVTDDAELRPIERPDHDISQSVSQLVNNTTPVVNTETATIDPPSGETDRTVVVVRVHEADRKPVATSDSAYYVRINDQKQPMNRQQVESMFVERDRRQQAIRQLEFELARFENTYEDVFDDYALLADPPDFNYIDTEGIRSALKQNTHLYTDEDVSKIVSRLLTRLRHIESVAREYDDVVEGRTRNPHDTIDELNKDMRKNLQKKVDRLQTSVQELIDATDVEVD